MRITKIYPLSLSILITCLLNSVGILYREVSYLFPLGVKGLNENPAQGPM